MNLYHYNKERFRELKTRELQGVVSSKERRDGKEGAEFRGDPGPYYDSISFLLEPAPVDILASIFPADHHTWRGGITLNEYLVDAKKLEIYGWKIVESTTDMLFMDHVPWSENDWYKKMYFRTRSAIKRFQDLEGSDLDSLIRGLKKIPSGTTREMYEKLRERKDYDDIKGLYAATVPHLMIYTKEPIKPESVRKVKVAPAKLESREPQDRASWRW